VAYNPYPRLPLGPLSDLYGMTRALYRASRAANPPLEASRLEALEALGRELQVALRVAPGHPGTIAYQQAWTAVERVTLALQGFVDGATRLAPLIEATVECIARARSTSGAGGAAASTWRGARADATPDWQWDQ
jgi:hypothetical protein